MEDFFDDGDDFDDGDFMDEEPFEDSMDDDEPLSDEMESEAESEEHCGPDWEDIAFLGAMAEEIAEDERERRRIERENEKDR